MNRRALEVYFAQALTEPAKLGHLDCVRFVIEAIRAGWGVDFRRCLRYHCRREAVDQLRADGGLREAFSKVLGEPLPVSALEFGDIAYLTEPYGGTRAVGLVMPTRTIALKARRTILRVPLTPYCAEGWTWARP